MGDVPGFTLGSVPGFRGAFHFVAADKGDGVFVGVVRGDAEVEVPV